MLRAKIKALQQSVKDKGKSIYTVLLAYFFFFVFVCIEHFYLVYWTTEDKVSIHHDNELKEPPMEKRIVGESCVVSFGRKCYSGTIACTGEYYVTHPCVKPGVQL